MPYSLNVVKNVFNISIEVGIFSQIWKSASVVPLLKVTSPTSYNDLRPISILPAFSKLMERIL